MIDELVEIAEQNSIDIAALIGVLLDAELGSRRLGLVDEVAELRADLRRLESAVSKLSDLVRASDSESH